ncbi:5'-3' exoribonuclease 2 [Tulasnella sp. 330]|nr:5'-3' exoribonuclease 2 [Tulasnella sp. 330]KAG8883258.1 5'-3' exoribonuclease 2 [Tulasnella sp. 331]KAG8888656.1 5'-3' exoribonuclease 2 [Tulasnella sp. 332]
MAIEAVEEDDAKVADADGNSTSASVDISQPNPNGTEFDNLYLDMNGIVHPCTHPEGKPAPETEEEMMVEIFKYTERVVSMVRPRRLLFMAIDGVAPRAKMNQQRSRRFRSSQDAAIAAEELKSAIAEWEAMGKVVSDDIKNKKSWDYNAITPGTPFMSLLATSLRYWVVKKMNTDPGWKNVIISDASVPGEGEHKIMDWIRRQRVAPGYNPNTQHVIYGLDADLIMLALATHEPHFRVLREDVFDQAKKPACHQCGGLDHRAADCTIFKKFRLDRSSEPAKVNGALQEPRTGFIFLNVSILREYLKIALGQSSDLPFTFDFELAIDDWIFLIFMVGNDFLPHLPSLDIRQGGITTLVNIWKAELPRMGGFVTNHGHIHMDRLQIILEGLAKQEGDLLRKAHEDEERQKDKRRQADERRAAERNHVEDSNKRARPSIDNRDPSRKASVAPTALPSLTYIPVPMKTSSSLPPGLPSSLPARPSFDMFLQSDPGQTETSTVPAAPAAVGVSSNHDVVANRKAMRMANMSAAEALRTELAGLKTLGRNAPASLAPAATVDQAVTVAVVATAPNPEVDDTPTEPLPSAADAVMFIADAVTPATVTDADMQSATPASEIMVSSDSPRGVKRTADEVKAEDDDMDASGEDEDVEDYDNEAVPEIIGAVVIKKSKTEEHDDIHLWEPGYQARYYRSKFEVDLDTDSGREFRSQVTKSYVEGLCWVLHYYYQGTPSWQWFYPYHYAPFAGDCEDVPQMNIQFRMGQPFKPFEQLMSVFPPASRKHIPEVFHHLMLEATSPIIEFYPTEFEIDMNGQTATWKGISLLPFIDEARLLEAMKPLYPKLSKEEAHRNTWGSGSLFTSEHHSMYHFLCGLYTKRKRLEAVPLDPKTSNFLAGQVVADPLQVPGATYQSPLPTMGLEDIPNDRSISVLYYFPKQTSPHRSVLLPGVVPPPKVLSAADHSFVKSGGGEMNQRGGGRGGGRGRGGRDNNFSTQSAFGRGSGGAGGQNKAYGVYGAGGYQENYSYGGGGGGRGGRGDYRGDDSYNRGAPQHLLGYGGYQQQSGGVGRGSHNGYGGGRGNYGTPSMPPQVGRGGVPAPGYYNGAAQGAQYGAQSPYGGYDTGRGGRGRGGYGNGY